MTTETQAKFVPGFDLPFGELIEKGDFFDSSITALEWLEENGSTVLKEQAMEVVNNLLSAVSEERRSRGLLILERAVKAQTAWLQMFDIWSSNRRFRQLKEGTDAIRDADASSEDHEQACKSLLEEHQLLLSNIEEEAVRRQTALDKINDFLVEKLFIEHLDETSKLVDRRPTAKDQDWAVKALDLVRDGKAEAVSTRTLEALAGNLEFHAKHFFGDGLRRPNPSHATKAKGGRSAQKRAADREATMAAKGKTKK